MTDKILFIHIPKTAGSTFAGILHERFLPEQCFYVNAGSITSAKKYYEVAQSILADLDERIIKNTNLIQGHMPFISEKKYEVFSPITFLRDPVRRVVSDYLYTKSTFYNPLHHILQDMPLKDYVSRHRDLHLDNLQTRLISGKIDGDLSGSDLQLAEHNLNNQFKFYGFTEHFGFSLILLNQQLNWHISRYSIKNVTKRRNNDISESDLKVVREYNKIDQQLYDNALKRFLDLINKRRIFFEEELKKIKADHSSNIFRTTFGRIRKLLK